MNLITENAIIARYERGKSNNQVIDLKNGSARATWRIADFYAACSSGSVNYFAVVVFLFCLSQSTDYQRGRQEPLSAAASHASLARVYTAPNSALGPYIITRHTRPRCPDRDGGSDRSRDGRPLTAAPAPRSSVIASGLVDKLD